MTLLYSDLLNQALIRPDCTAVLHVKPAGQKITTSYLGLSKMAKFFCYYLDNFELEVPILPIYMAKSASCIALMMGCLGAKKKFSVLNRKLRSPQINNILEQTKAQLIVTDGAGIQSLKNEIHEYPSMLACQWLVVVDESFNSVHKKTITSLSEIVKISTVTVDDVQNIFSKKKSFSSDNTQKKPVPLDESGCCLFTSGSTGVAKGVLISSGDLTKRASAEIECFNISSGDVLLSLLPFSFDVGLNQLHTSIVSGATLVILDSWLPTDILTTINKHNVTGISAVPSIWLDLIKSGLILENNCSLRYITISGGSMSNIHQDKFRKVLPDVKIYKTYGQTEAFRATCLTPEYFHLYPDSVGKNFEGANVYIVGEDGEVCLPYEVGEVYHSGLGVMLGYLGLDDLNKKIKNPFKSKDDSSNFIIRTGDYGFMNEEGFLFLKGRKDSMIKISGNRVYISEITEQIQIMPEIDNVVILDLIENDIVKICAFIVLEKGINVSEILIKQNLAKNLPSYMIPEYITVLSDIPLTENGKPNYQTLRDSLNIR